MMKEAVLNLLEGGGTVSGKDIAKQLGVTRSAVWKAIEELRRDGYNVEAATNRGYRLAASDVLNAGAIRRQLRRDAPVYVYSELESTNITAKQLALAGCPAFTVVAAERQSGGRGRRNRSFFSPPASGVYFSVVLRPRATSEKSLLITSAAAVAVCRAAYRLTGVPLSIKWVNDVYKDGKKLCGILTEGGYDFETGSVEYAVVGIGINVRAPEGGIPEELKPVMAYLAEDDTAPERNLVISEVVNCLAEMDLEHPDFMEEYRRRSWVIGRGVNVIGFDTSFPAEVLDVTDEGHLMVRDEAGNVRVIGTGEVSIRRAEQ